MFRNEDVFASARSLETGATRDFSSKALQEVFAYPEKSEKKADFDRMEKFGANLSSQEKKILREDLLAVLGGDTESMKKILDRGEELRRILIEVLRDRGFRVEESYHGSHNLYGTNYLDHDLVLIRPNSNYGTKITKTTYSGEANLDWSKVPPKYSVKSFPV